MSKIIELTKGHYAIIDDEDYPLVSQYKWHFSMGYALSQKDKERFRMHRLITNAPDGMEVDHINGNRLDNRKDNLRICTRMENAWNVPKQHPTNTYKGVTISRKSGRWRAQINYNNGNIALGTYDTDLIAAVAYDHACREYFGEYAKPNFPEDEYLLLWDKYKDLIESPKTRQGKSQYLGVFYDARGIGAWQAQVAKDGKVIYAGRYQDEIEAAKGRDKKALELFGEQAPLNFPRAAA
jgi:hypothetical protein